ncbi:citrate/2-methylcitrate synthase, partial [Candidatus Borrarchaeum sp.]|uniref:citrate/2-methylcitrate synthase n=1 Tax=Candidatus Borrarchaeum sp. TaxID=2846742 RepID=UPI00257C7B6E
EHISQTKTIETVIVGLGRQGTRHAKLMHDYGTTITCGVAPGKGGTRVHETIPVYETAKEALKSHPNIAVASIWRHYSTAKDATIEAIEAGIPIVVLITEGIPLRDVRDILVAVRKHNTILFGGNTPGIIFPPEGIKVGMLPDIFHPEEVKLGQAGPKGVTVISRSGAILYHLSDALSSAGIAQNAVLGIGGDGAIGSRFIDLVQLIMNYKNTDLVVIAGEIGGMQEESLAQDIQQNPENYIKPLVALISGANAPAGKTMGHAGAVVAPGQSYGTYESKKTSLERAGVVVVNSQRDLIQEVKRLLNNRRYFRVEDYYKRMQQIWGAKPPEPTWGTLITKVVPNNLLIRGYPLQELIEKKNLLEIAFLVIQGEFPKSTELTELEKLALRAIRDDFPVINLTIEPSSQDISKTIGTYLLLDDRLLMEEIRKLQPINKLIYTLGRVTKYFALVFGNHRFLDNLPENSPFSNAIYRAFVGEENPDPRKVRLLEAMISACVDHGVTPPSAQTTLLLASSRTSFEVALAGGVQAITDVHGGAGAKAAEFFLDIIKNSKEKNFTLEESAFEVVDKIRRSGKRIQGLGHRIHTKDPRRDILWKLSEDAKEAKECVELSKMLPKIFHRVKGMSLPINVDGVIGAITADMKLSPLLAKVIFIFGRMVGLAAHYFEEVQTQSPMRMIVFKQAVYKGKDVRHIKSITPP